MDAKIDGSFFPVLRIALQPGEGLVAETGELSWKSPHVTLTTSTKGAGQSGFWGSISRMIASGGLFMTEYRAEGAPGILVFAAKIPGHITEHDLDGSRAYLVHRHGFIAGTEGVRLDIGFQRKLGAGLFGGDGFILQKISGYGRFWAELGGEIVAHDLAPGEQIDVHPGHIGMFEESVQFDITTLPGIRNKLFGGDGIFLARLTGPGRVWLQTLTLSNLAGALRPYLGSTKGMGVAEGTILGSLARKIFS